MISSYITNLPKKEDLWKWNGSIIEKLHMRENCSYSQKASLINKQAFFFSILFIFLFLEEELNANISRGKHIVLEMSTFCEKTPACK